VRPWFVILLAAVAAAVIIIGITEIGTPTSSARTSKETVTAENGVVQNTVAGSGNVEPGVDQTVNFATSGTLQSVNVKVGQHVKKGQLIATLDPSTAEQTLEEAQDSLAEAEDNLTEIEDGTTTGSSGNSGSSGDSGNSGNSEETATTASDTTEYTSYDTSDATASVASARKPEDGGTTTTGTDTTTTPATTTTATTTTPTQTQTSPTTTTRTTPTRTTPTKTTPSKTKTTASKGSTKYTKASSKQTASKKTQAAASEKSAADRTNTTATTANTTEKSTPSASEIEQAELQVQEAQQTVTNDEKAVDETKLYAPVGGMVASLSSDTIGQTVSSGSSAASAAENAASEADSSDSSDSGASDSSSSSGFAQIINNSSMTMTVSLSESDISSVKVGQIATVSITALSGVELAGKVTSISPLGSDSSGVVSYDVTLTINQTNSKVLPGMSATATIVTQQAQGVTVENQAITGTGSDATVQLIKNGKTTTQPVVVGLRGSSRSQIISGLKSGQDVQITITLPALGTSSSSSSTSSSTSGLSGFGGTGGFGGAGGGFGGRGALRAFFGGGAP
jgi:multidrug efflux pump subunit AcrA (membrane-fusion protein)